MIVCRKLVPIPSCQGFAWQYRGHHRPPSVMHCPPQPINQLYLWLSNTKIFHQYRVNYTWWLLIISIKQYFCHVIVNKCRAVYITSCNIVFNLRQINIFMFTIHISRSNKLFVHIIRCKILEYSWPKPSQLIIIL